MRDAALFSRSGTRTWAERASRRGVLGCCAPERCDFVRCERPDVADLELAELERADRFTAKFFDTRSHRFEHAPDLLVASLLETHVDPALSFGMPHLANVCGRSRYSANANALTKRVDRFARRARAHFG